LYLDIFDLKTFYTYLLISRLSSGKNISYAGYTNNIKKRLILHNTGRGAKFTKGREWFLIYKKKFKSRSLAMKHEHLLKKNRIFRQKILKKVSKYNHGL